MQFSLLWIIFVLSLYFTSARTSSSFHPGEEDLVCTLPNYPPPLTAKMKGLLRGFKYISQMFDEKEPEMQIGLPTDVRHVAHIGMDGPSANKPSWMTEFSSAPELSAGPMNDSPNAKPPLAGNHESSLPPLGNDNKPKKSRRKASIGGNGSPIGSPRASTEKPSRRHRSSNLSMESPGRESPNHPRRSNRSTESSSQEQADVPKKSRRKKSKGSSDGSGSGKSRSKELNSMPDIMELGP